MFGAAGLGYLLAMFIYREQKRHLEQEYDSVSFNLHQLKQKQEKLVNHANKQSQERNSDNILIQELRALNEAQEVQLLQKTTELEQVQSLSASNTEYNSLLDHKYTDTLKKYEDAQAALKDIEQRHKNVLRELQLIKEKVSQDRKDREYTQSKIKELIEANQKLQQVNDSLQYLADYASVLLPDGEEVFGTEGLHSTEHAGSTRSQSVEDLKAIQGIGPYIEQMLNHIGIHRIDQLASLSEKDLDEISTQIKVNKQVIMADDWIGQAKRFL